MPSLLPPKKDVALALLERASVFVHLDPRDEEVLVPAWFKRQSQLVLQVGLNMAVRIPDLEVGDDAISCTLSFTRSPHYCYVPWKAVYALVGEDGRGMVWPEDIPPEVAAQTQSLAPRRPSLRSLDGGRGQDLESDAQPSSGRGAPSEPPESKETGDSGTHPEVQPEMAAEHAAGRTKAEPERTPTRTLRSSERPYLRLVK